MGKGNSLVLVVEDEHNNRELAIKILSFFGYAVECAANGKEAIERVKANKPDLILMDLSLPIMDGWEATKLIKALPDCAGLPIIAVTAHAMGGDRETAIEVGCIDYVSKPFSPKQLVEVIQRYLK